VPYKIIVADPSPSVQKAAQLALAEPEFRVFVFEDGASLLESVTGVGPDALVVSLTLPGREGYEVARTLRSRKQLATVPLIGLRGAFECIDSDRTVPPDYDEVVPKPFNSEHLAAVVRELIARKTGPSSLPEEPVWPGEAHIHGLAPHAAPAASVPPSTAGEGPRVREIVREEIIDMEREIEKRVRARVLADLKEWMSKS
jgi:DNA-binding response OmpR family regulator